ncbi:hypothetical protein TWF730_008697 [Orbilia blumenaviensis]|uniref:Clr5 domain-containing protein n=1 Tax=Orbilia blumenaviensis TaxID=1796055 RepID=A0AAV9V3T9_9PEZI
MHVHKSRKLACDRYRDKVALLYHLGNTQAQIKDALNQDGVKITKKQLEYRLKRWNVRKNLTQKEYQYLHKLFPTKSQAGKTLVYLNDFPISQEKLQRGLQRNPRHPPYKLIFDNMSDLDSPPEGISFFTPSRSITPTMDFDTMDGTVDYENVSLVSQSTISSICWPLLPLIAHFLFTVVNTPSLLSAKEQSVLLFLKFVSDTLPAPRMRTYEEIEPIFLRPGARVKTRNTSLFYAVMKAIRGMNIRSYIYSLYRKFLDSPVVEEFIHIIFSLRGPRGCETLKDSLHAILESRSPKSASLVEHGTVPNSPSYLGDITMGSGQTSTSRSPGEKRKRAADNSDEYEEMRGRNGKRRIHPKVAIPESLRQGLACPFAKGAPDLHDRCRLIRRQNLSGIKEHLKRAHYGGILLPQIKAARTWDAVFGFVFPDWGIKPIPGPYIDAASLLESIYRFPTHTPSPTRSTTAEASEAPLQQVNFDIQEGLGSSYSSSGRDSARTSLTFPGASRSTDSIVPMNFANHDRIPYETSRLPPPRQTEPSISGKKYTLMVTRLPSIPISTEKPGPKRFTFDNFHEFDREFDQWLRHQFTDPLFSWRGWELLNQFTNVRLRDKQSVMDDVDFSFVAQNSTRAALYLVAKHDS